MIYFSFAFIFIPALHSSFIPKPPRFLNPILGSFGGSGSILPSIYNETMNNHTDEMVKSNQLMVKAFSDVLDFEMNEDQPQLLLFKGTTRKLQSFNKCNSTVVKNVPRKQ